MGEPMLSFLSGKCREIAIYVTYFQYSISYPFTNILMHATLVNATLMLSCQACSTEACGSGGGHATSSVVAVTWLLHISSLSFSI